MIQLMVTSINISKGGKMLGLIVTLVLLWYTSRQEDSEFSILMRDWFE